MGRRRKKIVENVTITGIADKGMSVGRSEDGQVLFIKGGIPGDVVDVLVLRKKKSYAHGIVHKTHHYSSDRIEARCQHFGICGGCKWQNMAYGAQIKHKHQTILDAMTRIAGLDSSIVHPTKPCDQIFRYRNKLEYSFSTSQWLTREQIDSSEIIERKPGVGFHPAGSYDKVVDVEECHLQDSMGDKLRNFIRNYAFANELSFYNTRSHNGFLRNMIFRNNSRGEWMVIIAVGEDQPEELVGLLNTIKDNFPSIISLYYVINQKQNDSLFDQEMILFNGDPYLKQTLGDVTYCIGPKSFFQTNTEQAKVLYDTAVDFCDLKGDENVYDLYTGIGSIALYVADRCRQVVGIEEIEPAIEDAILNRKLNGIENASFYAGDVKNILTDSFAERHGKPDLVITDPPRAGMHADVVQMLLQLEAPKIVYVSCNPSTQARDLKLLSEKYQVTQVQGVDMFPHTHHIESVARCELK
ncbi:MAG: 23S rRNA (uracil(1939)-C(5))-methyltransferase RlmD [Saprospiraceae bacterium]|nr:23S rRNA (uracil(1939)-C(5))-methyltransferase RlmD [Saprospiraceae bacterium]